MIHIFYHSADLDGHCSGAIAFRHLEPNTDNIRSYGINYGQDFPFDVINRADTVYMLDFCLQPFDDMLKLNESCNLVWIDHHKSAIEEADKHPEIFIKGAREIGKSGCELTWEYMHDSKPMPKGVNYLGRYDVWDLSDPVYLKFQYGMKMHDTISPNAIVWSKLLADDDNFLEFVTQSGDIVLTYKSQEDMKYVSSYAFPIEFEGYKTIACNKGFTSSQLFDSIEEDYDILLTFVRMKEGRWTISMYTTKDDIDVGAIAKSKGGGGHKGAAGFQADELPF